MIIVIVVTANNLISMGLFMYEEYFNECQNLIIDIIVTTIFIMEFIYNFIIHPAPKSSYFKMFETYIDLLTILSPIVSHSLGYKLVPEIYDCSRGAFEENNVVTHYIQIIQVLRILKVFRVLRLNKLLRRYTILSTQDYEEQKEKLLFLVLSPV